MFLVLAETVLIRKPFDGQHFQPELFWSWKVWNEQKTQVLTNIIMFIQVGVLTGLIWKWRGLLVAIGLSAGIEALRLITARGLCEFDDVMHNMLGADIDVVIAIIINTMLGAIDENNRENR